MYQINIHPKEKKCRASQNLYGLFFEDINRAGDGGLYAELIRNRAFDDGILPENCTYDARNKLITSVTGWCSSFDCYEKEGIAGWAALNGASMQLTDTGTLHPNRRRALEVRFCGGRVENDGFRGIPVQQGAEYRFYMFAKAEQPVEVTVSLAAREGACYSAKTFTVAGNYKQYACMFTSPVTDHDARLALTADSAQLVTLGFVSLFPKDTYKGRENGLRRDLAELLVGLHPAFLRFPGGCIVEGFTEETAFRFKDTIGPVWTRKPHWLLWSYMTTNGLGYHDYLQFCEDAGMDAMYVFNCGMTCQARGPVYMSDEQIEEMYEDAVQAIEYAIAPADTEWGAKRAANGHPEPFMVLKYLEIGNENYGPEYHKRYKLFYERLKARYPQFIYISNEHTERVGLPTEMADEHFYASPRFFTSNTKLYDQTDRSGPKIYCGEYASTVGCTEGTLHGALGEAAFLTGIERNQDAVTMTSYAPLFQNVAYKAWEPDMIVFNNHDHYLIPSYHVQQMFAAHRGSYVCAHEVAAEHAPCSERGAFGLTAEKGASYENVLVNGSPCELSGQEVFLVGSVDENAQHLSCLCSRADSGLCIRFWDSGKQASDQEHFDWIVENGKSRVEYFNGWSWARICGAVPCEIQPQNRVEIRTEGDTFCLTLNGTVIHQHRFEPVPCMTAVCTVDETANEVITKLVNLNEEDIQVRLCVDVPTAPIAAITTLTADRLDAGNSFEHKQNVWPETKELIIPEDGIVCIKARSVNVIRQKLC